MHGKANLWNLTRRRAFTRTNEAFTMALRYTSALQRGRRNFLHNFGFSPLAETFFTAVAVLARKRVRPRQPNRSCHAAVYLSMFSAAWDDVSLLRPLSPATVL